ncbi:MAG: serine/threonine-protein kinase [Phycisphaerales bacterium]
MARTVTISRFASTIGLDPGAAAAAPDATTEAPGEKRLTLPERLGPVRLIRPLGEGGMGVVWLGRHELLNLDVAVKFLLDVPRNADDPQFAAFIRGAQAAAATHHPGLNRVIHADITPAGAAGGTEGVADKTEVSAPGVPYLVMEYIDGPSLSEVLKATGPLSTGVVRAILQQVCAAVSALHWAGGSSGGSGGSGGTGGGGDDGVVHRDIKPANIMLTLDGRVVVTDFGLACPRPTAVFGASAGPLAGTPPYMAPEMFEGIVSARTDVYAIGITAYQLLSGRLPYEGSVAEIRAALKERELDRTPLIDCGVPEPVIEAIERTSNRNVLFRPKALAQVQDLFEQAFRAAKIEAVAPKVLSALARGEAPAGVAARGGARPARAASTAHTLYETLASKAEEKRKLAMPPPRRASEEFEFTVDAESDGRSGPPAGASGEGGAKGGASPGAREGKSGLSSWLKRLWGS